MQDNLRPTTLLFLIHAPPLSRCANDVNGVFLSNIASDTSFVELAPDEWQSRCFALSRPQPYRILEGFLALRLAVLRHVVMKLCNQLRTDHSYAVRISHL